MHSPHRSICIFYLVTLAVPVTPSPHCIFYVATNFTNVPRWSTFQIVLPVIHSVFSCWLRQRDHAHARDMHFDETGVDTDTYPSDI